MMYIHGIYVVYPGIFLDIPSFLKPDFSTSQCCWSHSMRTRVWMIKNVLFHAPPWQLCLGKTLPTKDSTAAHKRPLSWAAMVMAAVAASRVPFLFTSNVADNYLFLGERWDRGCPQSR